MPRMPFGAQLDARQRMEVATVSGHAERLILSLRRPVDEQAVAELRELSTDPVVYGVALGNTTAMIERAGWVHLEPEAELYRRCGADPEVAERQRLWRLAQPWPI